MSLKQDYKYCRNIIKENSKSFYAAFSTLPREKRNSIYAIYAFCRFADDSVDILNSREKLLELKTSLDGLFSGNPTDTPIFRALAHTFSLYSIDSEPFYHMLKGQMSDFEFIEPKNLKEFKEYCYYVAGTVGLMLLPIIATENQDRLKDIAISLGEAMQITNILRDIGEDYDLGRIYIPLDLLDSFPDSINAIRSKTVNDDFISCWEYLAGIAERNYALFFNNLDSFDFDSKKSIASSAVYYGEILNVIRENGYDCLSKRQYVSSFDMLNAKLKLLLNNK